MKKERKIIYGVIIGVLSILLLLTLYLLFYFFSMRDVSITKEYVKVNDEDSINFTIKLKDNNYITDASKVTTYVTDMIDYVNVYYDFKSVFSDEVKGKVTVNASATLIGNSVSDNTTVLYNEFYTAEEATYTVDGSVINLADTYKLDFDKQNKTYKSFAEVNNIGMNGYIRYEVTVNYKVYNDLINDYISKTTKLYANMPLGGSTQIELSDKVKDSKMLYKKMPEEQKPLHLVICLELFGASVLFVILIIMVVNQIKTTASKYEKELDKLLDKYKRRIVKLRSVPDLSRKNVVLVKSFDDLNNVSKVKNINFVEIIENKLSVFYINDNDTFYVYNFDSKRVK